MLKILLDYVAELMAKALHFVTHQDDTPSLPEETTCLASQYNYPDKDLIPLFSSSHVINTLRSWWWILMPSVFC